MNWIRKGLTIIWKLGYPLAVYYLAVFSWSEILAALGVEAGDGIAAIAPGALLTVAILWFPYRRDWILRQGVIKKPVPTFPPQWHHLIILGIAASLAGNILLNLIPLKEWFPAVEEAMGTVESAGFFSQLFGVCLVIPAAEELVFRGLAYSGLRDEMGAAPAAVISALYFGVFHGNLVQGIYAALLGLILAFLMERYHSLTAVWLAHAAMNAGSIYILNGALERMLDGHTAAWILAGLLAAAVTAAECRMIGRTAAGRSWVWNEEQ